MNYELSLLPPFLYSLFFRQLADEQHSVTFRYDAVFKSLDDDTLLSYGMHDAVAALDGLDVRSDEGVAVRILLRNLAKAAPGAQVAPSEAGRKDEDVLSFLQDGIVDGYVGAVGKLTVYDGLLTLCTQVGKDALEDVCYGGFIDTEGVDDGRDVPDEEAGIPVEIVLHHILAGGLQVGLLAEAIHGKQFFVA